MSEPNEDITTQPHDGPQTTDFTDEPPHATNGFDPDQLVIPSLVRSKVPQFLVLGALVGIVLLCLGLAFPAIQKVREASARAQSNNNVKQMALALNNIASNTTTGDIPPAYGEFPSGSGNEGSFFKYLLPYIEQWDTTGTRPPPSEKDPIMTYIAPADPYNPGTNGLSSYGSNATLLTVGGSATLPGSFGGRTSSTIVVFERTAKSGATWSSSNSYLIDASGSSTPEFGPVASWSSYGNRATALTSVGCTVGMGDGSARVVTQGNANAGWAWAMNPQDPADQPLGW